MTTKVGLMGFGRIGRNLFRILYKRDDIQVTATATLRGFLVRQRVGLFQRLSSARTVRLKQAIVHQGRGMIGLPNLAYLSESRAYVLVAGFRSAVLAF